MPWWTPIVAFGKKYAPAATRWLITKLGGEVLLKRVEASVASIGDRQNAIRKARQFNGRFGPILVEGRNRYVVYKGEEPIEIFPPIKGDLKNATAHYDTDLLRDPTELTSRRARGWAQARFQALAQRLRRGEGDEVAVDEREPVAEEDLSAAEEQVGNEAFASVIDQMEPLLAQLVAGPARPFAEHDGAPATPGIYLFSEGPNPIYVGQSRDIRRRLKQHTSLKSHENQAPLAFNIALKEARARKLTLPATRKQTEADPAFQPLFVAALERVAGTNVQFVEIDDPVTRTVFEVYAAKSLGTDEFNLWETH